MPCRSTVAVLLTLMSIAMDTPEPLHAQATPAQQQAEAAVRGLSDDFAAGRWTDAAERIHPRTIARFRESRLQEFRHRTRTRDETLRYRDDMPEAVREWFDAQRAQQVGSEEEELASMFGGITDLAELEALSGVELLARHLEAADPRTVIRRTLRERRGAGGAAETEELASEALRRVDEVRTVLGSVVEDDSTIHVLYRAAMGTQGEGWAAGPMRSLVALPVVRSGAEWYIAPAHDSFGIDQLVRTFDFGFWVELPDERAERLDALKDRVFAWPDEAPRLRAWIEGYKGAGAPPRSVVLAATAADGRPIRFEIPHGALSALFEYLEPWAHFPDED
jgi:hypothetical protein